MFGKPGREEGRRIGEKETPGSVPFLFSPTPIQKKLGSSLKENVGADVWMDGMG
jgi:hypothetical protein